MIKKLTMRKMMLTVLLLATGLSMVQAQKMSIENVYKVTLRNSDAIKEGSEVKGYYFFYVSDKIDKKTNEYTLKITDDNLKSLKDIKFQDSKYVTILESSFNGSDLIFLMYNSDARTFEYQVYGADGKKKYTYNRELSKKEIKLLGDTYLTDDDDNNYKGLYPVDGKGFISNMPSREDKDFTFQLDFFSTQKRKQWTYIPTEGAKKFVGDYLGTFNGVVYMEILKFTSNMDGKPDSYILGLDLETGKQLFENSTDQNKYKFYPATMSVINNGKAYLFGEYFDPNGNISKDKSLGFAFWGIDEKGKIISEKYNSWDLDMGRYLDMGKKGRIDDFGYMYLHNIVQAADGNIFAVGEGYHKNVSAMGVLSQIASQGRGGVSMSKMKITDMILIKFDKDFNVKGATIYDKNPNKVELPRGAAYVSTPLMGKLLKTWGSFDYSYSQVNKDATAFTVCYSDYVRGKDYKGGTFNSISYADGKVTTDHLNTKSDATRSAVMPGKQGQVLILDWYKKDKRLEAHFEKLN
jgi:hypothetical protein